MDVVDLREFYASPLGNATRRLLSAKLRPRLGSLNDACVMGMGFDLPLLESTVDLALVVHGLELTDSPIEMLQEVWRVMAPQGRLVLVVPNRRGLWAAFDTSPFGYGQPFSRTQLSGLLKEAQFSAVSWSHALQMPPTKRGFVHSGASAIERLIPRFKPALLPSPVRFDGGQ